MSKNIKNINKIHEFYSELEKCYSIKGCDHERASTILNAIINRKKYLETSENESSSYVDCKKFLSHYVHSMVSKEHDYDEINIEQILKIINEYSAEQKLHLIDLFKRELEINGYSEQANQLKSYFDKTRLQVYFNKSGFKSKVMWLSLKLSYRKRYLFYWLVASFFVLTVSLIRTNLCPILIFNTEAISNNLLINHISNVLILIFEVDPDVNVKPINIAGVILIIIGKIIFLLFIVNFLIRRIFDNNIK